MTSYIRVPTRRLVRRRSGRRCEYCRRQEIVGYVRLHVDHIIAEQHGGETVPGNLAFCCGRCNWNKGPNIATIDPETGEFVRLFHPRLQRWEDHFAAENGRVVGLTPIGRGTARLFKMNHPRQVQERREIDA